MVLTKAHTRGFDLAGPRMYRSVGPDYGGMALNIDSGCSKIVPQLHEIQGTRLASAMGLAKARRWALHTHSLIAGAI